MKSEKGITLIVLITTIVIMVILASVAINTGYYSIESAKLQNFNYELQQVQGKVDTMYEKIKLGNEEYKTLGSDITISNKAVQTLKTVKNIDYTNLSEDDRDKYYYDETNTKYRYLSENEIRSNMNISSNPGDMIINFETREVISVDGYEYKDEIYYSLDQMR